VIKEIIEEISYYIGGKVGLAFIFGVSLVAGLWATTFGFKNMLLEWGDDHLPLNHWWGVAGCHIDAFGAVALPTAIVVTVIALIGAFDISCD